MTKKQVNIGQKAKVVIEWHVQSLDYSREKEANIIGKFAKKYGISKENIEVRPKFIVKGENGKSVPMTNDIIMNIQDPKFQVTLFLKYAEDNKIEGFDIDAIKEIDAQINALIDYDVYDKYKRYEVKWIKWSNFLSYGPDNYLDFTKLHGLVHLKGEPANQSGKSTLAYDLLHFLLFGKPSNEKADVLSKVFNKYLPEAKEVSVEGCLCIDNQDYVIKRVLTRPELKRRSEKSKVTQKISYYKLTDGIETELADVDNMEGVSGTETNKIIKEAIGNEKDFDLVISANADNLKDLISLKDTDRGRLLNRWIGLLPLEEKDKLAREKWNHEVQPRLLSNRYNREELKQDIEDLKVFISNEEKNITNLEADLEKVKENIKSLTAAKEALIASKQPIDPELLKVDVQTVERKMVSIVEDGKQKRAEVAVKTKELETIGPVEMVSDEEFKRLIQEDKTDEAKLAEYRTEVKNLKALNESLTKSEYCPTCGRKFENVDNSERIAENTKQIEKITKEGKDLAEKQKERQKVISDMESRRSLFARKSLLEVQISALNVTIQNLLHEHKEQSELKKKFESNRDAIANNNNIDLSIRTTTVNIENEENRRVSIISNISDKKSSIADSKNKIDEKNGIIKQINEEDKIVKNWKIYLQLVGKDGIGKMVLRQALPIINAELDRLLDGVVDFKVEVTIDNSNDVAFNLINDGVVQELNSGSGLEQTAASIALRAVLGKISTMPKPSFIVLDEILGGVAEENLDYMKELYNRILPDYSQILHITHLPLEDWSNQTIVVKKENHISKVIDVC